MRLILSLLAILFFSHSGTAAPTDHMTGFRQISLAGSDVMMWYPTDQTAPITKVAENKVFFGVDVIKQAPIADAPHPLVILSHGYSGLWRNQAWLAGHLARAGYVVASFNHSGTSFPDMNPSWAKDLTERPHQVSRILSALLQDPFFGSTIDQSRISVIGHSLGGSTALLLAGGTFSPSRLLDACGDDTSKMVCTVYRKGGLTQSMAPVSARDERVSSVVLLDMEGIHAFTPDSLASIEIPLLALASGVEDPALPIDWESRQQATLLPTSVSRYAEVIGATHFSFMSRCKPGASALLEQDAYVCEGETAPREQLHQQIAQTILTFLRSGKHLVSALQAP